MELTSEILNEFKARCQEAWPELEPATLNRIQKFYELLVAENEVQNLTRLISPKDFVEGHLLDVRELQKSGLVDYPAMDLGSGGGVPGLLSAIIDPKEWILVDSEIRKGDFLKRVVSKLDLSTVKAFSWRAEEVLKKTTVESVVARAVGKIDKIYGWVRPCSTWNTLVLLKGPGWDEEWATFQASGFKKDLEICSVYEYTVGEEKKTRKIIKLRRLKRK